MVNKWIVLLNILLNVFNYSEVGDAAGAFDAVQQIMFLLFPPSTSTVGAYKSLILTVDRFDKPSLANFPILTNDMWKSFKTFYFLCPAEKVEDVELNEELSETGNSLFLVGYYENKKTNRYKMRNINEDVKNDDEYISHTCKKRVKAFVNEFGFQDNVEGMKHFTVGFEVCKHSNEGQLFNVKENRMSFEIDEKFEWLQMLSINFDPVKHDVSSVFNHVNLYYDGAIIRPPRKLLSEEIYKEGDYKLGKDVVFEDFDISSAYQLENQKNVFHRLFESSSSRDKPSYFHEIQGRYLVKAHLASLDLFSNPILTKAARTYVNVAPMWKIIRENAWFKVENYVNLLSQAIPKIDIETGTYGTLELSGKKIYLADKESVRVPQVFWKIIHYTTMRTDECYNIIIVTANNPYENTPDIICKENQCAKLGWEYVQQDHYSMGLTSCCQLTPEIIQMIKTINFDVTEETDFAMNLNALPHWKTSKLTLNVKKFLEDRMNDPSSSIRVDHSSYRNEKDVLLDNEIKEKNKPKALDEHSIDQGMVSTILENYVEPYWSPISNSIMQAFNLNGKSSEEKSI